MRRNILLMLVLFSLTSGFVYCAEGAASRRGEGHRDKMEEFLEKENLSPQEKAELSSYRDGYRKQMESFRAQLKACREELRAELERPSPDRGAIDKVSARMKQVQAAMLDARIEAILTMKAKIKDIRSRAAGEKK